MHRSIYHGHRLCIPSNDKQTREELLKAHHDGQDHFGVAKIQAAISRDYLWPGVSRDVETYIRSCDSCARNKSPTQAPAGLLHPLPVPENRFAEIAMDFIGPLPRSHGFDSIFVITDRLTNYVRIEPTNATATAPEIADLFYRTWYRQFGLPSAITSDRDKLFMSHFWKRLMKKMNIHLRMSTAHHPETDGASEKSNKTAVESLRQYANARQTDWVDHLIQVEAAMNNSVNATTTKTPTELLYGVLLRLIPGPIDSTSEVPAVTTFLNRIQESITIAKDQHIIAKTRQTTQANKNRRPEPRHQIGDLVYLNTKNLRRRLKKKKRSAKLYPRFIGPFLIIEAKPETSTYKLMLPEEYKIHPVFHARLLKPAFPNDPTKFPNREPSRPNPVFPDEDEYEIEMILDHRDHRGQREYLVHWVGYPKSDDSWIKEKDLHAPDLLKEYQTAIEKEEQRHESPPPEN